MPSPPPRPTESLGRRRSESGAGLVDTVTVELPDVASMPFEHAQPKFIGSRVSASAASPASQPGGSGSRVKAMAAERRRQPDCSFTSLASSAPPSTRATSPPMAQAAVAQDTALGSGRATAEPAAPDKDMRRASSSPASHLVIPAEWRGAAPVGVLRSSTSHVRAPELAVNGAEAMLLLHLDTSEEAEGCLVDSDLAAQLSEHRMPCEQRMAAQVSARLPACVGTARTLSKDLWQTTTGSSNMGQAGGSNGSRAAAADDSNVASPSGADMLHSLPPGGARGPLRASASAMSPSSLSSSRPASSSSSRSSSSSNSSKDAAPRIFSTLLQTSGSSTAARVALPGAPYLEQPLRGPWDACQGPGPPSAGVPPCPTGWTPPTRARDQVNSDDTTHYPARESRLMRGPEGRGRSATRGISSIAPSACVGAEPAAAKSASTGRAQVQRASSQVDPVAAEQRVATAAAPGGLRSPPALPGQEKAGEAACNVEVAQAEQLPAGEEEVPGGCEELVGPRQQQQQQQVVAAAAGGCPADCNAVAGGGTDGGLSPPS
jgi:hypothetical protein